jgi:hypothetical protein
MLVIRSIKLPAEAAISRGIQGVTREESWRSFVRLGGPYESRRDLELDEHREKKKLGPRSLRTFTVSSQRSKSPMVPATHH